VKRPSTHLPVAVQIVRSADSVIVLKISERPVLLSLLASPKKALTLGSKVIVKSNGTHGRSTIRSVTLAMP
jgi:hypothetical protein